MLSQQNANLAKGQLADDHTTADILANDQLLKAVDYKPLIVGYHNGAPVRLSDVANVQDGVENIRTAGYLNGKPSILLIILRSPGANIIDTVDRIKAALPSLKASIPAGIKLDVVLDRTTTIRASVREIERTLLIAIALVILVVFVFLRSPRATLIPAVVVPVSLIGTFGVMYLFGYSLDNLSLMALTISTGFVVDDAIVVIENVSRHLEMGMSRGGGAERRARSRLHRAVHQHFAGGGVHSASADGRHRRPPVPRICRRAVHGHPGLARRFAHHHADDVLAPAAASQTGGAWEDLSRERKGFCSAARRV